MHLIPTPELSRLPTPGSGPGTPAPQYAALRNGLVSWWQLANGVTGALTLADSGPANHTALNSGVTFSSDDARAQEPYTLGTPGAAQFGTANNVLSIGDGTPRRYLPASDFTFACFVKFTSLADGAVLVYSSGINARYQLRLLTGGLQFTMVLTGGGSATVNSAQSIAADTWYFVACDYDSDEENLGIRVTPTRTGIYESLLVARDVTEATGGVGLNSGNLYLGGYLAGAGFVGRLLAVGFWSRLLNEVELGTLNAPWDYPWAAPISHLFVSSPGPDTTLDLETEGDSTFDEYEIWRQRERGGEVIDSWFPIALDGDGIYSHESAGIAGDVLSYRARGRNNLTWGPYGPTAIWTIGGSEVEHLYEDPYAGPYADAGPAPTNLLATGTAPVVVTWDDQTGGVYGHEVWRDDGNGFFQIAEVAAGLASHNDDDGTVGSDYKVRAYGNGNPSAFATFTAAASLRLTEDGDYRVDESGNERITE